MFQCTMSRECFPKQQMCDSEVDCKDGSDEGETCGK